MVAKGLQKRTSRQRGFAARVFKGEIQGRSYPEERHHQFWVFQSPGGGALEWFVTKLLSKRELKEIAERYLGFFRLAPRVPTENSINFGPAAQRTMRLWRPAISTFRQLRWLSRSCHALLRRGSIWKNSWFLVSGRCGLKAFPKVAFS